MLLTVPFNTHTRRERDTQRYPECQNDVPTLCTPSIEPQSEASFHSHTKSRGATDQSSLLRHAIGSSTWSKRVDADKQHPEAREKDISSNTALQPAYTYRMLCIPGVQTMRDPISRDEDGLHTAYIVHISSIRSGQLILSTSEMYLSSPPWFVSLSRLLLIRL